MKYENEFLKELMFPVGGIGTGCISINGAGLLRDFEIFNRPSKGSVNGYTHFAVRVETPDGKVHTRAVCGDEKNNLTGIYNQRHAHSHGYGYGLPSVSMNGFPHFRKVTADCTYPVAVFTFEDRDFPGKVKLTAWNPLIPHDTFNSSLPAAFFTLGYEGDENAKVSFAFSFCSPFSKAFNTKARCGDFTGLSITADEEKSSTAYGDITLLCSDKNACVQTSWYRGGWCDDIVTFFSEFSGGSLSDRSYPTHGKDHGTVMCDGAEADFILAWNIPNCENYWNPLKDGKNTWKNRYAVLFENSVSTAEYCMKNRQSLFEKTLMYVDAMFSQTLPEKIIEAAADTVSVLRSPTVMLLEDGSLYGFEGSGEHGGSCEGLCQHVWNYAYALCFLFPDLERSIRELEFNYETLDSGETHFRLGLPAGRKNAVDFPCFDGQMGCIIKTFREWKISGDGEWLKKNWHTVTKILDFARSPENRFRWDADCDGFAEGRMHHTLDMELFGANGWLEGMYLAALKAAYLMAEYLGDREKENEYRALFESGSRLTRQKLFNGRWFIQNTDLSDKSVPESFGCTRTYWNEERKQIKYQMGEGCGIDQLLGQWHASITGIGEVFDSSQAKTAAYSIYENNFRRSMRNHVNPWRLFAVNDEAGTVICSYPEGTKKPFIPIPYCEECMNGFEYAFAGTLIAEGFVSEGIEVAEAVRNKYDGSNRNPFNEIECGNNYARSMASFALIPLLSGFSFDMSEGYIGFSPKICRDDFRCFWSVGNAFGTYSQTDKKAELSVLSGEITLNSFSAPDIADAEYIKADGMSIGFGKENGRFVFDKVTVGRNLIIGG